MDWKQKNKHGDLLSSYLHKSDKPKQFKAPPKTKKTRSRGGLITSVEHHHRHMQLPDHVHRTSAKMHTDREPDTSHAPNAPFFLSWQQHTSRRNPLLPSTSTPFLFLRRQWWTARFLQPPNAFTASVCQHAPSRSSQVEMRVQCGAMRASAP